jgi:hypothetical protein
MKRYDHPSSQMSVKANTVLKVLKTGSGLSLIDILVRESIQNSLDAGRNDFEGFTEFYFDTVEYNDSDDLINALSFLRQEEPDYVFQRLIGRIERSNASAIILSDRGTTGLSGPVKYDDNEWHDNNIRKNFANLVYELGQNHGAEMAGGSFGFGKSIYYRISEAGLVMYYSRSAEGERLAFCMISKEEQEASHLSTGVCWWGETSEYKGIKYAVPVTDPAKIDEVFTSLKMEKIRLEENETGTSISIIGPRLNFLRENVNESEENEIPYDSQLLKIKFEEAVQKWYWPRMIETNIVNQYGTVKPLKFFSGGKLIPVSKQNIEKGKLLEAAENLNMGEHRNNSEIKTELLTHRTGNVKLGTLAYRIYNFNPGEVPGLNCISMIRAPRMVVYEKYIQGSKDSFFSAVFLVKSDEKVFRNNKDTLEIILDNAFRDSESSTHSEWNIQNISEEDNYFRYYVKKAIHDSALKIENAIQPMAETPKSQSEWSPYSTLLGKVLATEDEGFATTSYGSKSTTREFSGRRNKSKLILKSQVFETDNMITFCFCVKNISNNLFRIYLKARGGRESLNKTDWEKKIGREFPFIFVSAESESYQIIQTTEEFVQFMGLNESSEENTLVVKVKTIKKDASIDFELYSFK